MLRYRIPVDDIPLPAGLRPAGSGGCRIPRRVLLLIAVGALLGASVALAQTGGGFDLTWNTVDGGGGTSGGGNFSLTGSIG